MTTVKKILNYETDAADVQIGEIRRAGAGATVLARVAGDRRFERFDSFEEALVWVREKRGWPRAYIA